jgi:hypothetical protein
LYLFKSSKPYCNYFKNFSLASRIG